VDDVRRAPSFAQRVGVAEAWTRQLLADARAANAVDSCCVPACCRAPEAMMFGRWRGGQI